VRQLNSTERLDVLRQMDNHREWFSLDDKRICAICETVIDGRRIEIVGKPGAYSFHCPTKGCPSNFSHWWFLHQLADASAVLRPQAAT
jgi:hypothetical protein